MPFTTDATENVVSSPIEYVNNFNVANSIHFGPVTSIVNTEKFKENLPSKLVENIALLPISMSQVYFCGDELKGQIDAINKSLYAEDGSPKYSRCIIVIGDGLNLENMKTKFHIPLQTLDQYIDIHISEKPPLDELIKAIIKDLGKVNPSIKQYSTQIIQEFSAIQTKDNQPFKIDKEYVSSKFQEALTATALYAAHETGLNWLTQASKHIVTLVIPFEIIFWDEIAQTESHKASTKFINSLLKEESTNEFKKLLSKAAHVFSTHKSNKHTKNKDKTSIDYDSSTDSTTDPDLLLINSKEYIRREIIGFDALLNALAEQSIVPKFEIKPKRDIKHKEARGKFGDKVSLTKLKILQQSNPLVYKAIVERDFNRAIVEVIFKATRHIPIINADIHFLYPYGYFDASIQIIRAMRVAKELKFQQDSTCKEMNSMGFRDTFIPRLERQKSLNNNHGKAEARSTEPSPSSSPPRNDTDDELSSNSRSTEDVLKKAAVKLNEESNNNNNLPTSQFFTPAAPSAMSNPALAANQLNGSAQQQQNQPAQQPVNSANGLSPATSLFAFLTKTLTDKIAHDPEYAGKFFATYTFTLEKEKAEANGKNIALSTTPASSTTPQHFI